MPRCSALWRSPSKPGIRRTRQTQIEELHAGLDGRIDRALQAPATAQGLRGARGRGPAGFKGHERDPRRDPENPNAIISPRRDDARYRCAMVILVKGLLPALNERGGQANLPQEVGMPRLHARINHSHVHALAGGPAMRQVCPD